MNPAPEPSDDAVEARIVAWVHGESSSFEAAALEQLCQDRPELAAFRRRIKALHESLTRVEFPAVDATWKLPATKRKLLEELLIEKSMARTDSKKVAETRWTYFKAFSAIAACLLFAVLVFQTTRPSWMEMTPVVSSEANHNEEIYGVDSMAISKKRDSGLQETTRQKQLAGKKPTDPSGEMIAAVSPTEPDSDAFASQFSSESQRYKVADGALNGPGMDLGSRREEVASLNGKLSRIFADRPILTDKSVGLALESRSRRATAAAPAEFVVGSAAPHSAVTLDEESSDTEGQRSNFPFTSSDVSFQLAKAALAQGKRPDPRAIRLEEFYNAVDYGDPAPAAGEPVAVAVESSAHPFLPGTDLVRVAIRIGSSGRRDLAENLKVRVNFNPQRVGKHQLLGFEQEGLTSEGVKPTRGKTGVAIYLVEPLAGGSGDNGEVSVNFRDTAREEMTERTFAISSPPQPPAFDRAPPSMQLAGLALLAAEKLRGGATADRIDFNELTGPISRVKQSYASNPRVGEMLEIIAKLK